MLEKQIECSPDEFKNFITDRQKITEALKKFIFIYLTPSVQSIKSDASAVLRMANKIYKAAVTPDKAEDSDTTDYDKHAIKLLYAFQILLTQSAALGFTHPEYQPVNECYHLLLSGAFGFITAQNNTSHQSAASRFLKGAGLFKNWIVQLFENFPPKSTVKKNQEQKPADIPEQYAISIGILQPQKPDSLQAIA